MLVVLWLICGIVCAAVAGGKHRSAIGWLILGLLFPLIAVIIILALPDARPQVIVIQNGVATRVDYSAPSPAALPADTDTSRWSDADRARYGFEPAPGRKESRAGAILTVVVLLGVIMLAAWAVQLWRDQSSRPTVQSLPATAIIAPVAPAPETVPATTVVKPPVAKAKISAPLDLGM